MLRRKPPHGFVHGLHDGEAPAWLSVVEVDDRFPGFRKTRGDSVRRDARYEAVHVLCGAAPGDVCGVHEVQIPVLPLLREGDDALA